VIPFSCTTCYSSYLIAIECLTLVNYTTAVLDLHLNTFLGSLSTTMGKLPTSLTAIDLSSNGFQGNLPTEIGTLTSLTDLRIARSDRNLEPSGSCLNQGSDSSSSSGGQACLSGTLPTELGLLTRLEILWLFENSFTGTLPSELGLLTNIKECLLFTNSLEGDLPSTLSQWTSLGE
jgi:hypothetical protein